MAQPPICLLCRGPSKLNQQLKPLYLTMDSWFAESELGVFILQGPVDASMCGCRLWKDDQPWPAERSGVSNRSKHNNRNGGPMHESSGGLLFYVVCGSKEAVGFQDHLKKGWHGCIKQLVVRDSGRPLKPMVGLEAEGLRVSGFLPLPWPFGVVLPSQPRLGGPRDRLVQPDLHVASSEGLFRGWICWGVAKEYRLYRDPYTGFQHFYGFVSYVSYVFVTGVLWICDLISEFWDLRMVDSRGLQWVRFKCFTCWIDIPTNPLWVYTSPSGEYMCFSPDPFSIQLKKWKTPIVSHRGDNLVCHSMLILC